MKYLIDLIAALFSVFLKNRREVINENKIATVVPPAPKDRVTGLRDRANERMHKSKTSSNE